MITRPQPRRSVPRLLPAPTGGLDDSSSVAAMDPLFAIEMVNFFPAATELEVRKGFRRWNLLEPGVETLMSYSGQGGVKKLFAFTNLRIADVTTVNSTSTAYGSWTKARSSGVMFSTVAAQYLVAVNGQDSAVIYNGTIWAPMSITGVTSSNLSYVTSHMNRLWFVEKDTNTAWYLGVDSISGTAQPFYLGGVFSRGGFLQSMATWTVDSGSGMDDLLIFISSEGEIAAYAGTDPSNASTWELQAVYYIGRPLTDRCTADLAGDLVFLTEFGVVAASSVIGGLATGSDDKTLSRRISKTLNEEIRNRLSVVDWEISNYPKYQYLMVAFPPSGGQEAVQYVMNTVTGAWTKFDLPMVTSCFHDGTLFFTNDLDDGLAGVLWAYGLDDTDRAFPSGSDGVPIQSGFSQAYTNFDDQSIKSFQLVKPTIIFTSSPAFRVEINTDFAPGGLNDIVSPVTPETPVGGALWNVAKWDEDVWQGAGSRATNEWIGVVGSGFSASLMLKMYTNSPTRYSASTWVYHSGGAI